MAVYQQELDNMVRWDGKYRPFYEVHFLKCHPFESDLSLWVRYTLLAPHRDLGPPSASVWAVAFGAGPNKRPLAAKETWAAEQALIDRDIFYFQLGDCAIYNNGARGRAASGGHEIRWDLQFVPNETSELLYPFSFYHLPFPKTKYLAPNASVRMNGEFWVDGEKFRLVDAPGCQAHLWGTQHAERWAWSQCNQFHEDSQAVFEALSGQVRVGKKLLRPLTAISLRLGNGLALRFNRISQLIFNESSYDFSRWELSAHRGHYRLKIALTNRPAEMAGVTYTDPDGSARYCYHSESADLELWVYETSRRGDRLLHHLTAPRSAAFEVVEKAPVPEIPLLL